MRRLSGSDQPMTLRRLTIELSRIFEPARFARWSRLSA